MIHWLYMTLSSLSFFGIIAKRNGYEQILETFGNTSWQIESRWIWAFCLKDPIPPAPVSRRAVHVFPGAPAMAWGGAWDGNPKRGRKAIDKRVMSSFTERSPAEIDNWCCWVQLDIGWTMNSKNDRDFDSCHLTRSFHWRATDQSTPVTLRRPGKGKVQWTSRWVNTCWNKHVYIQENNEADEKWILRRL